MRKEARSFQVEQSTCPVPDLDDSAENLLLVQPLTPSRMFLCRMWRGVIYIGVGFVEIRHIWGHAIQPQVLGEALKRGAIDTIRTGLYCMSYRSPDHQKGLQSRLTAT